MHQRYLFYSGATGDRRIPRANGQWRGKCFHLMTSSCSHNMDIVCWLKLGEFPTVWSTYFSYPCCSNMYFLILPPELVLLLTGPIAGIQRSWLRIERIDVSNRVLIGKKRYIHTKHVLNIMFEHFCIEAETKWTPFRRRHFQTHFLVWKC